MTTLLWRLRPRSRVGIRTGRSLDKHLERAPDEPLGALRRAPLDHLDQALQPLDLDLMRDLLVHLGGLGAAPRRVDERERAVVADLLGHLERLLEVLLGLPREADDDVGRQRAVGDVLADQRHAVEVALAGVGAPHALQDRARAGLKRQMDVLAQRRQLGVRADHVLAHVLRVRARVADPLDAGHRVDAAQQLGERDARLDRADRVRTS